MSKYIDRDKLAEFARHSTIGIDANDIMRFPTADVVEVVRCKDCIHWLKDNKPSDKPEYRLCEYYRGYKNQEGYCDFGTRRESKVKRCFDIPKEVAERLLEDTERKETE